jgi:hypothetical protein
MYLLQKVIITVFGLGLALLIFLEMKLFYTGQPVPITSRVILDGGGVLMVRTAVNLIWILLVGVVAFTWVTPLKK